MTFALWAASGYCGISLFFHLASLAIAMARCRAPAQPLAPPADAPPVSIIRPVCGLDNFAEPTLASTFTLDYPRFEIVFCVASANDRVVPLVQALIAAHPDVPAKLMIGNAPISANPKLNNVAKGWSAARHDLVVMADSNVLMPPDYLQRLLAAWRADTGMVSAPPIGSHPQGFWAELECSFLNTYQARWQYTADSIGMGFAQGKTLCYRRTDIERAGGLQLLAAEAAEDAASTKLIRATGRRVRLVDAPFQQPLGHRSCREVWERQLRWARLRRDSFAGWYGLEATAGGVLPLAAALWLAFATGHSVALAAALFLTVWYGAEMLLAATARWHLSPAWPLQAMLRDAMLPLLWIAGWRRAGFTWRGNTMSVDEPRSAA